MTKKKYISPKIYTKEVTALMLRNHSFVDSYNSVAGLTLLAYPGCGHSCDTISDIRLKKNIKKIDGQILSQLIKLNAVTFRYKYQLSKKKNYGLIAQDLEKYFPELVNTNEAGYKSIQYDKITVLLLEAIKELNAKVDSLSKQIRVK